MALDTKTQLILLKQAFTAVGHEDHEFQKLVTLFYTGMIGEYFEGPEAQRLEEKVLKVADEEQTDEDALIKAREILLEESKNDTLDKYFLKFLKDYINHMREKLDPRGQEIIDQVLKEANSLEAETNAGQ